MFIARLSFGSEEKHYRYLGILTRIIPLHFYSWWCKRSSGPHQKTLHMVFPIAYIVYMVTEVSSKDKNWVFWRASAVARQLSIWHGMLKINRLLRAENNLTPPGQWEVHLSPGGQQTWTNINATTFLAHMDTSMIRTAPSVLRYNLLFETQWCNVTRWKRGSKILHTIWIQHGTSPGRSQRYRPYMSLVVFLC